MGLGLAASYSALCIAQGGLVAVPLDARRRGGASVAGLAIPGALLGLGVGLLRTVPGAPHALATLGWSATPALAIAAGWLLRPLRPAITVPLAAALYLTAWRLPDTAGEVLSLALIALAVLSAAAFVRTVAAPGAIQLGLVVLCILDTILVWGTPQVGPADDALSAARSPLLSLPLLGTHPLPALQQVTLGPVQMGWLDLLAAALLALTLPREHRLAAAIATGVAAAAWGLLLAITSPIAATPPVLAGLGVAVLLQRRSRSAAHRRR